MSSIRSRFLAVFLICACLGSAPGQVRLPKLISDGMVLQRDTEVRLWGWASPGEPVSISFKGLTHKATTAHDGKWAVTLKDLEFGGPYKMEIRGTNSIDLKDIYIGDVWVCSGQSNMELTMSWVEPLYPNEMATASNQAIRYFEVPRVYDFTEVREELEGGNWKPLSPGTIGQFSAVAYFFAKNLYSRYQVPIGLINASLGGSPVESWISEEALKQFPQHLEEVERFKDSALRDSIENADQTRIGKWYSELYNKDQGLSNNWRAENLDVSSWNSMNIPGYWADNDLGPKNGVVWFRKQVKIPKKQAGKPAKLLLGRIVDADSVFVNGIFVGNTTYQYPPRRYDIPAGVLEAGENSIAIRIINESGRGGFVPDKEYKLVFEKKEEIDLTGTWKYKLGAEMPRLQGQTFIRWKPVGLYNAMINPLTNYAIKGVIWYQGESNVDNVQEYEELFSTLIGDWRNRWDQGKFPFLYVQLANFLEAKDNPGDSDWARLRETQAKTLTIPNTGMAVTIDIGEWNDIHPLNKKDVGDRLAQAARKVAYGENTVSGGPLFESFTKKGDSIILSFTNVGKGLFAKGDSKLKRFAIAGENQEFVWAEAQIKGDKVIVSSPKVKEPVAVRYGWADNPEGANLYNEEGYPASPFRTDNW